MCYVFPRAISWLFRVAGFLLYVYFGIAPTLAEELQIDGAMVARWKAYEDFARSLQGTEWSTTSWDSGKVEKRKIIRKQNRQCVLMLYSDEDKPFEQCKIANPWYAALLKRSKLNPSEVSLSEYSNDPQADFPGTVGSSFATVLPGFSPHFYVGTTPLSQFVTDPHFKIKNITKRAEQNRQLIQLDYIHTSDSPKTGTSTTAQGQLVLDPERCWCIIRRKGASTVTLRGARYIDDESETEYETFDHPSGFPLLTSAKTHLKLHMYRDKKAPNKSYTRKNEYQWEVSDHVPNEEFTLSAFGLPEPRDVKPLPPSRTWLWLLAATVAATMLAIVLAWLKRRRVIALQTQTKSPAA